LGNYAGAVADLNDAIDLQPNEPGLYKSRARLWVQLGRYRSALADFDQSMKLGADDSEAWGEKAWLFATCPDERYRDGPAAVVLATKACSLDQWKSPTSVDALATACAEAGDFAAAVRWEEKAVEMATSDTEREEYNQRLALFRAGKAYHETPATTH
jgi:tetratricopeptide (TPR) repeat protein